MSENFDKTETLDLDKELEGLENLTNKIDALCIEIQNDMELLEIAKKEQGKYKSLEKQLAKHPENEVEIKAEMLAIEKKVDGLMAQIKPLGSEEK